MRAFDNKAILNIIVLGNVPLMAAVATMTYQRRETSIVVWFATIAAALLTLMAFWQSRWSLNASGVQICLILVVLAAWTTKLTSAIRWATTLVLVGALFIPSSVSRYLAAASDVTARRVSPKDAGVILSRDIATALRATQPEGDMTVLSSPNGSVGIGYYGRFKTLGTLYWENSAGLKAAAAVYSAQSEEEAAKLIRAHGITHIAIVSEENFIQQYCELLHPNATAELIRKSFGFRLFFERVVPQWLQMIPYKAPDDLSSLNLKVMLFKVNFNQSLAEAIYNVALTQISQDAIDEAERTLNILLTQAPQLHQPWLRKAELLVTRRNWTEAAEHMLKGIALAPAAERPGLYGSAASIFYNQKQHALAIRIYRAALAEKFSPDFACYLSWILATSEDENLRSGKEAIGFAQRALESDPNSPSYLSAVSAALAENNRFPEAVNYAERAVASARVRGDQANVPVFEERLAIVKSGKPIRK